MKSFFLLLLLCISGALQAQEHIYITVTDKQTHSPLPFVTVSTGGKWLATTDTAGKATASLPVGKTSLHISFTGYTAFDTTVILPGIKHLSLALEPDAQLEEVVVLASTRTNQKIENSPMKVEVLGLEELNEEAAIKPGNISSILGDVSGVQIQQSSAVSGNSNVRIQGLGGKYTQILRDGMPLYDGFSGGFGILTVPPLDLKQIELIKGSASTLYGGGAIGGLVNLISKRPLYKQQLDLLANYTTLKEANVNAYASKRNDRWGYTLFAGYTRAAAVDVNKDGFSSVPRLRSLVVHPRVYYYPSQHTTISIGYSGSFDDRKGGDMQVLNGNASTMHRYYEYNTSERHTGEYMAEHTFGNGAKLTLKGIASNFDRDIAGNTEDIKGTQLSYYSEASIYLPVKKNELVAGVNVTGNDYKTHFPDTLLLKRFGNVTTGIFGQYSVHIKQHTIIETGLRLDANNKYGVFVLPRAALFHRFNGHWATRAGFGMGYKTPNPLVQQNTEYSISQILPVSPSVTAEVSYGYNVELNYKKEWDKDTKLFINHAFFLTQVNNPVIFEQDNTGKVALMNEHAPVVSKGFDTYVKLNLQSWEFYLGYTFTDARNTYLATQTFIPLTPKNRWASVLVKEIGGQWRLGLEGSFNGRQHRYDGSLTPSCFFLAAMIQRNIGERISLVLNGENLFNYRMDKVEPIYAGTVTNPVFKPLWAPIDGRVINLSLRWKM